MNNIANRQAICQTLMEYAAVDKDIVLLVSDSRGSASMTDFVSKFPEQYVETGIAEQNIVGIAAGLAASGKKPFVASPACFLTMRSIEQIKVDIAYSRTNVKLIGISGGVSYGALGMTHHSLQDIAVLRAIPDIAVMVPADRHETQNMIKALLQYDGPAYLRVGRNPVDDVYPSERYPFEIGKAVTMRDGKDITIIAYGETVKMAIDASDELKRDGIGCRVLNMHTLKPLDELSTIKAAEETGLIITIEEHSVYNGLGAAVTQVTSEKCPVPVKILGIADEPAIPGKSQEVFAYYGLTSDNIINNALNMLKVRKEGMV